MVSRSRYEACSELPIRAAQPTATGAHRPRGGVQRLQCSRQWSDAFETPIVRETTTCELPHPTEMLHRVIICVRTSAWRHGRSAL